MFLFKWGPRAQKAWRNVENSSLVKRGMTNDEVLQTMGPPDVIEPTKFKEKEYGVKIYYYEPPFMASNGIEIFIGQDSTVTKILPYEGT